MDDSSFPCTPTVTFYKLLEIERVPLGSSPDIRRKRPYKIGAAADVEAVQRMYPCLIPGRAKTEWEIMGLAACLGPW